MISSYFKLVKKEESGKENKKVAPKGEDPKYPTGKTRVKKVSPEQIPSWFFNCPLVDTLCLYLVFCVSD